MRFAALLLPAAILAGCSGLQLAPQASVPPEMALRRVAPELGRPEVELSADAEAALSAHSWPGNIREMRNVLERALLLSEGERLTAGHLRFDSPASAESPADDTQLTLAEVEQRHIERVLAEEEGNVAAAARRLGVPKSSLYQRIKKLQK